MAVHRPIVCYVTDRHALPSTCGSNPAAALMKCVEHAARSGVDWIQLREKDLDAKPLFQLASEALAVCRKAAGAPPAVLASGILHAAPSSPPRVLINDRLDVAWAVRAAGVHLGENSLPLKEVAAWKKRVGARDFLVGASCHSLEAALQAESSGADYIFFGPIFETPSKRAFGAPQGLAELERICQKVSIPVLAIGGITSSKARECFSAGAAGIAAIRLFQQEPASVDAELLRIRL